MNEGSGDHNHISAVCQDMSALIDGVFRDLKIKAGLLPQDSAASVVSFVLPRHIGFAGGRCENEYVWREAGRNIDRPARIHRGRLLLGGSLAVVAGSSSMKASVMARGHRGVFHRILCVCMVYPFVVNGP